MPYAGTCRVEAVLVATEPDSFITRRVDAVEVDLGGIPGDRHHGLTRPAGSREPMYPRGTPIRNRRQLSAVSVEECAAIADRLGLDAVLPEWLGANLLLSGLPDLTRLPAGARLLFPGGAGLVCEGENRPCRHPGEVLARLHPLHPERGALPVRFVQVARGRRGIVLSVERPGRIARGDQVRLWLPRS
ncbi:MAG TPA: MOSC domain-containing protein [Thermaerobacter sp.]